MAQSKLSQICSIPDCLQPAKSLTWCGMHYARHRRTGSCDPPILRRTKPCLIDGCLGQGKQRGFCGRHYWRWRRYGDPRMVVQNVGRGATFEERFWSRVAVKSRLECWEWTGYVSNTGYGSVHYKGKSHPTHRVSYCLAHNSDMPDLLVRHTCDNRVCVNPMHLLLGTALDNVRDKQEHGDHLQGERVASAKLTTEEVRKIKTLLRDGMRVMHILARYPQVSKTAILHIKSGTTWRHV